MVTKKAVCLISGGLDSAVTTYIAKEKKFEIYGLTFDYGQKHSREVEYAKKIAEKVGCKKHIVFKLNLERFGGSSLIEKEEEIEHHNLDEIGVEIPSTYVPARNLVFLSIGLSYSEVLDANALFIGATATDYSGYPDCRPEFFEAFQKTADLATKKGVEGNSINIQTPLLHLSKAEIIEKGLKLDVPFKFTWSCYQGKDKPCGRCDSCQLRLKGFKQADAKDPLEYKFYPKWYKK
ncbi:MAG: 7-cyano-7-deazaguanine synthase QueC [Candidatus Thermoplasmatota archaeon]